LKLKFQTFKAFYFRNQLENFLSILKFEAVSSPA